MKSNHAAALPRYCATALPRKRCARQYAYINGEATDPRPLTALVCLKELFAQNDIETEMRQVNNKLKVGYYQSCSIPYSF